MINIYILYIKYIKEWKFSNVLFPLWYFLFFSFPLWIGHATLLCLWFCCLLWWICIFNFQVLDKFIGHENSFALPLLTGNLVFLSDAYFGFMEKHFLLTHLFLNFSKIYETIFGFQSKSVAYLACPWKLCDYFHLAVLFLFVLSCLSLLVNGSIFYYISALDLLSCLFAGWEPRCCCGWWWLFHW